MFPYFFLNFKLCPFSGGWRGGYITQEPLQGRKAGGGVRTSPVLHHNAVLLAVTLEKSPIRSLGSLSKMFSMVPFGEDARDKD